MRKAVGSRIAQYKKELEILILRMQFFHLDPQYSHFTEIIEHKKLCSEQEHVIDWWKLACFIEYGDKWQLTTLNNLTREQALRKYVKDVDDLIKKHDSRPTTVTLDRIWYLFFASGDYKYLRIGFETAGNSAASSGLRDDALKMFESIREQYAEKIREAKNHDKDYFKNHEISNTRNAESKWLDLDVEIQGKITQLQEEEVDDDDIDRLIKADKKYRFVPEAEIGKTDEEIAHEKVLNRGAEAFNRILAELNAKE
jgi:hypothetical protein